MRCRRLLAAAFLGVIASLPAWGGEVMPPAARIKTDRPRVLVRPAATPLAVSLPDLHALPRDETLAAVLAQLRGQDHAAAQALVWLMEGDGAAAQKAIARLTGYRFPGGVDTFHVYGVLTEFGLAYDWLSTCEAFTPAAKAAVRAAILPLARHGMGVVNDHMFHNYIWMSAGGIALWALATAGEDDESTRLYEEIRRRFNDGLLPAWEYLDGLPSEPMGYWALYVLAPGALALLGAQSAFETDIAGGACGALLRRNLENLIHSTLPDMRYLPWGDLQGGPNGGVTHEMAGIIDALTWALRSPTGAFMSAWLARTRGLARFYGETALFYPLYSCRLPAPAQPPLWFYAGGKHGGHCIARGGWDDVSTVVAFTCTDHFGDHHHFDQGSFTVYRNNLLAVDPPVYRTTRGPQQKTEYHNTLLIDGKGQRAVRGQWYVTVEDFKKNLAAGPKLETGDMLFWRDEPGWTVAAAEFSQAYEAGRLERCLRQFVFLRPDTVCIADQVRGARGKPAPQVEWLLQLPAAPHVEGSTVWATSGRSWIRCRALHPAGAIPSIATTEVKTHRATYRYQDNFLSMVHLIEVGDGERPPPPTSVAVRETKRGIQVDIENVTVSFGMWVNDAVTVKKR
jgi:hypothetical protein